MSEMKLNTTIVDLLIDVAMTSNCCKRRFGALAMDDVSLIGVHANMKLPHHAFLCEPECIRIKIPSGVDSMIGACGHAEEGLIWKLGNLAKNCDIYVAQIDWENNIVPKSDLSFYCARCATAMYYANVRGVWIYVKDKFEFLSTQDAIRSSYVFALGNQLA